MKKKQISEGDNRLLIWLVGKCYDQILRISTITDFRLLRMETARRI